MAKINIEIAYAYPDHFYLKSFKVEEGTMIQHAILQSGILAQFTEIDLRENKVGIFSRPAKLTDLLQEGDRIEIYRPLLADPKEIRRKRALEQQQKQKEQENIKRADKKLEKDLQRKSLKKELNND
ncbi:hypothetical protein EV697_101303 [Bisgaardia hudsonensis]|uniref:UPF0125 protein EV697_101303 n=1 Tax=Bisgaardia hudsonensis TaxID=109472 RepID=A0A4V2SJC1_9PAST|nr:RnfH family protein [Bisgaardia hudsonensis]TCP14170.1 hypothetical protein EV697_101303 [Bisgaardia hudsonensis]